MGRIRPDSILFTVILGLLAALPSMSLDISIPTLLTLQTQFETSSQVVALTITLFMVGFAAGQFGAGPLSDRYGRRPVLMGGLFAYTGAGLACAVADTAGALVAWRLVQGVGAGCCAVLAFAMIRDLFEGDAARSKRSYVTVVFGLAPILAPSIGAFLLSHVGWRPVYVVLALGGLCLMLAVWFGVPESRPATVRAGQRTALGAAYGLVLSDRRFVGLAAVNALSFGAMFAYIAGSPTVLMGVFEFSAEAYAGFFACTAASLTLGAWLSGRCANAGVGPRQLLWFSLPTAAGTAAALSILVAADVRMLGVLVPLILLNLFCRGLVAPNAQHMALEPMRQNAGTAAAAVGVLQILTGAGASFVVASLLPWMGPLGMPVVMAVLAAAALMLWFWVAIAPPRTDPVPVE